MSDIHWPDKFHELYDKAVQAYKAGNRQPDRFFTGAELGFLHGLGCSAQEIYDFAEDWHWSEEPSFDTVLLITAARRDYFLEVQQGQASGKIVPMSDFPAKDAQLDGIAWLPRIILKAKAKLRGELPSDLMYDCGGDRAFLSQVSVHAADFLRLVWRNWDDLAAIVRQIRSRSGK